MQSGFQGSLYGSSIKSQFAEVRRKGFGARHSNCMSQMHAKVLDDAIHLFFGHRFALSCSPDADIKDFRPPCPGDCLNQEKWAASLSNAGGPFQSLPTALTGAVIGSMVLA